MTLNVKRNGVLDTMVVMMRQMLFGIVCGQA